MMKQIANDDWTVPIDAATVWMLAKDYPPNRGIDMDGYNMYLDPALRDKTPGPLIASSLWLRLGFVAATAAVVALMQFYNGKVNLLVALAWIFGGAWLTVHSWRRAKIQLDRLDEVEGAPDTVTSEPIASKAAEHPGWGRREVGART